MKNNDKKDKKNKKSKSKSKFNDYTSFLNPENLEMWIEKGSVHLRVGQFNEAVEALKKAISLDPKAAAAYRMLGYCQVQQKNNKEACTNFAKAKELGDTVVDSLIQKYCK